MRLKALSLFSGAGGMDVGVRKAGFDVLACIESDPFCCETLTTACDREELQTKVIHQDIRLVEPEALMLELGVQKGAIDLLFGGPPCQPFSQIGKRGYLQDDRGLLLFEMLRYAEVFAPKAILIEQVKGLLTAPDNEGTSGGVFRLLLNRLEELGYSSKWKVVLAAEYGVPQLRERVFIVSVFQSNQFQYPTPTHAKPEQCGGLFPFIPYQTVGKALEGLPPPIVKNGCVPLDSHYDVTPQGDRMRIQGVAEGSHLSRETHLPSTQRGKLTKKDTTKFRRLSRFEPSLTLRCGEIFYHPIEDRYLTPRECMRLHGYSDEYYLCGPVRGRSGQVKYLDQHRQVANSVPPLVAEKLAQSIYKVL